jgi:hypothetical protein
MPQQAAMKLQQARRTQASDRLVRLDRDERQPFPRSGVGLRQQKHEIGHRTLRKRIALFDSEPVVLVMDRDEGVLRFAGATVPGGAAQPGNLAHAV